MSLEIHGIDSHPLINKTLEQTLIRWETEQRVNKLWQHDPALWTNTDEQNWLGWLNLPLLSPNEILAIQTLATELQKTGFQTIVLLGMGGSSLCPDLFRLIFSTQKNYPRFLVLDSTDPFQIKTVESSLDLTKTLFIVSSKSGSTLESALLKDYFYQRLQNIYQRDGVGEYFIAITDPGSALEAEAIKNHYKAVFYGNPAIGGRYSALSHFGMVPAGLMGLEISSLLENAQSMYQQCLTMTDCRKNPAVYLGLVLGVCEKFSKNKLTFILSEKISPLGAWLEQLIAESTGKSGKAIIPVDNEPLSSPENYSNDRIFAYIYLRPESTLEIKEHEINIQKLRLLEKQGHIVIKIALDHLDDLAGEFYRWEVAAAVASSEMGVNPFDQPDVEATKKRTRDIIISSSNSNSYSNTYSIQHKNLEIPLTDLLNSLEQGDYFAICAFIEMSSEHHRLIEAIREKIRGAKKVATCLGFGPRFLHSTGQAHKGGPNTGVFLQLISSYPENMQSSLPEFKTDFSSVILAQAQADLEVLANTKRRILQINLGENVTQGLHQLLDLI